MRTIARISHGDWPSPGPGSGFSTDSLLLAKFAQHGIKSRSKGLELGCGCGVISLGLMLNQGDVEITGLEIDPEMASCALENSARLGLEDRMKVSKGDVSEINNFFKPESFDFVLCNPPFRRTGTGRTSPDDSRTTARFEAKAGLEESFRRPRLG